MPLTHVLKRYKPTANKVRSAYRETQGKYAFSVVYDGWNEQEIFPRDSHT